MDHTHCQIFDIILSIFLKKHGENIDNPSIRIYINKIENRITLKFVFNKSFGNLLEISPKKYIFSKIFNSEFQEIEVWFTDQNN